MRARLVCQRGQLLKDWLTDDFYKNQIQPKLINVALAPACGRMHRNTIVPLVPKTHYGSG
jgi:hypothetical protein